MDSYVDEVAQEYLQRVRVKDTHISAACPFHKGGHESNPSFWIERATGKWGCFTCQVGGSGLKWFFIELGVGADKASSKLEEFDRQSKRFRELAKSKANQKSRKPFVGEYILPDALLGVFDWLPMDLVDAGYDQELLKEHDIGFDRRLSRVTYPIRDLFGNLIGISGRATLIGDEPKYLIYNGRRVIAGQEVLGELGEWYPEYRNDGVRDHLWRLDKCYRRVMDSINGDEQLIIVEGYKAALWLVQQGWINTVALMGSRLSPQQERIVRSLGVPTFVLLDNNRPGREGSERVCQRLAVSTFPVYEVSYPADCNDAAQPDDLIVTELEEALSTSRRVGGKNHVRRDDRNVRQLGRQPRRGP